MEGHDTGVRDALGHLPLDPLVLLLLDDLGLELLRDPPDLRLERDVRVVFLRDVLQPVHEVGPLVVVGPLLVDLGDRHADVDVLLDWHATALADAGRAVLAAALSALHRCTLEGVAGLALQGLPGLAFDAVASAAIAADPAHELARALDGERNERGGTCAGGETLRSRERAVKTIGHDVRHAVRYTFQRALLVRARADALCGFPGGASQRVSQHVGYILGHSGSYLSLPLSSQLGYPLGRALIRPATLVDMRPK